MTEQAPSPPKTDQSAALSRANAVQPGKPAGEVPQSDPSPAPPPNAETAPKGVAP